MSVFDICYNNVYNIKNQQLLYNFAPYRYTTVSPYPNYTQEQLNMRRKEQILNYTSNNQNSKTIGTTKSSIFSKLANNPSNRLSTTLTQNIDLTIPLYNYVNESNAYGTTLKTTTDMWNIIKDDNVAFINNTTNKLFRIQILDNIDKPKSNITYQTQVAIYISGIGVNDLITSSNYGYSIQLGVDSINVDIKYNDVSTGINGYLTYNFNSIESFSCNLPSFSNYLYLGMLTVTIPELPTVVGYVYDVYLTFNCKVTPNLDNFFNDFSYKVNNYCNLTQDFSLPSTVSYYIVNEITSSRIVSIPSYIKQIYYVLVGGGGGGNYGTGGGGGGGGGIVSGFITQSNSTNYTIIVGNGGGFNLSGKGSSIQGTDSILTWATATQGLSNATKLTISNGYMYVVNSNTNKISKISLTNPTVDYNTNWATSTQGVNSPNGIATDGIYIYVANNNPDPITHISNPNITRISLTNPDTSYNNSWATSTQGLSSPNGLTINNGYIYVVNFNTDSISKISLTNPTIDFSANWAKAGTNQGFLKRPNGITRDGTYLYVSNYGNSFYGWTPSVTRISISNPSIYEENFVTSFQGAGSPKGLTIANGYLYVLNNGTISQTSLTNPYNDLNPSWITTTTSNPLAITTDGTYLYTSHGFNANKIDRLKLPIIGPPGLCPVTSTYGIGGNSGGTNKSLSNVTGVIETGNSTNGGNIGTNVTDIGGYNVNIITSDNNYFTRYYGGGGGGNSQEPKENSLYGGASAGINNIGYSNIVSGTPNSGGGGGGQVNFTDVSFSNINTKTNVQALLIYNNQIYVSNFSYSNYGNSSSVYRVNLSNIDISYNLTQGINHPFGLACDGTYLYVSNYNYQSSGQQSISRISLTNPNTSYNASWATSTQLLGFVQGMVVDISGGYLYAANYYTYSISKISLTNPNGDYDKYWATSYLIPQSQNQGNQLAGPSQPSYLVIDNYGYLYVSSGSYISKISLTNPKNDYYTRWAGPDQGIAGALGMVIINDYLYVANNASSTISKVSLFNPSVDYDKYWATGGNGVYNPSGLATDGTYIYTANTGSTNIAQIKIPYSGGSGSVLLFFNASFTTGILYDNYIVGGKNVNTTTDSFFLNFNTSFFNQQSYYYDGSNYWTNLVFYTNGTVKITNMPIGKSVYLLVVGGGGGGGGGSNGGGGGGGGGVVQTQIYPTIGDVFTVTIGSGGIGGCANLSINSTNGGNTTVTSSISDINITAYGGGAAGQTGIGMTGASSGGNARNTNFSSAPVKIPNSMHIGFGKYMYSLQGYVAGSTINTYSNSGSSGGGGAGIAGGNGSNNTSGTSGGEISGFGGIGLQYSLNGIRKDYFWGGGGGGASSNPNNNNQQYDNTQGMNYNSGGLGGGGGGSGITANGAGGVNAFHYGGTGAGGIAGNGATNTGGGGGGNVGLNTYGGNGGSGIVIIAIQQ